MYQLKVWVYSSYPARCMVLTETWLRKSVLNTDVNLSGYKLFQQDRSSKGGGVAIFTKEHLQCSVVSTKSVPKQFHLLVLSIKVTPPQEHHLAKGSAHKYRQMRNKCTQAIRKAKVSYFKEQFSLCGSNPKKFWKMVKDLENKPSSSQLP
ncbi:unnamed protein product, partial [Coregonus sp. 'balchen']